MREESCARACARAQVRHMEQQLKRSLRFFGRGVVAFVITLTTVGLRSLQDVGFLGGVITIGIGGW